MRASCPSHTYRCEPQPSDTSTWKSVHKRDVLANGLSWKLYVRLEHLLCMRNLTWSLKCWALRLWTYNCPESTPLKIPRLRRATISSWISGYLALLEFFLNSHTYTCNWNTKIEFPWALTRSSDGDLSPFLRQAIFRIVNSGGGFTNEHDSYQTASPFQFRII